MEKINFYNKQREWCRRRKSLWSFHTTPHHYITTQYTTPHKPTLQYSRPHHTSLHHITPNHATPHHITPHYTTLYYTTLTTPHHSTPHHTTPHHITPNHATPHHTTLHYITLILDKTVDAFYSLCDYAWDSSSIILYYHYMQATVQFFQVSPSKYICLPPNLKHRKAPRVLITLPPF